MKSVATHEIVSSSEQLLHIWQTAHIKVDRRGWDMVSPSSPLPTWWPTIGRKLPSPAAPWEVKSLNPKFGTPPLKTCTWEMSPQTSPFESQWNWHLQDPPGSWCEKQLLKGSMNLVTLLGPGTGTEAEKGPDFLWKRLIYLKASAWGGGLSFNTLWGLAKKAGRSHLCPLCLIPAGQYLLERNLGTCLVPWCLQLLPRDNSRSPGFGGQWGLHL